MPVDVSEHRPDSVVTLAFELTDSSGPVTTVTETEGGRFTLEETLPSSEGGFRTFYTVEDCDPERVPELATKHDADEVLVHSHEESEGVVEVHGSEHPPATVLASYGALPRRLVVEDGTTRLAAEVPPAYDANEVIDKFKAAYPDAELTTRRQQPYVTPVFSTRGFERALEECLTDRQREVLQAAHEGGFFEWPRDVTGEQLGAELGIAPATFNEHIRVAERKLVQLVFDEWDS